MDLLPSTRVCRTRLGYMRGTQCWRLVNGWSMLYHLQKLGHLLCANFCRQGRSSWYLWERATALPPPLVDLDLDLFPSDLKQMDKFHKISVVFRHILCSTDPEMWPSARAAPHSPGVPIDTKRICSLTWRPDYRNSTDVIKTCQVWTGQKQKSLWQFSNIARWNYESQKSRASVAFFEYQHTPLFQTTLPNLRIFYLSSTSKRRGEISSRSRALSFARVQWAIIEVWKPLALPAEHAEDMWC